MTFHKKGGAKQLTKMLMLWWIKKTTWRQLHSFCWEDIS